MWVDSVLGLFAPSLCKGCGEVALSGLCNTCFETITDEPYSRCLVCNNLTSIDNLCKSCRIVSSFKNAYVVGESTGALKELVYDYKLKPERHLSKALADSFHAILPILPSKTIIVPIPTIPNHIRQRGFGHTELLARSLARKRHLPYRQLLTRTNNVVLHGLKANERKKAASDTFSARRIDRDVTEVLLIDDIYTTGSTVNAAAKTLKDSGIENISLAIIARHSKK